MAFNETTRLASTMLDLRRARRENLPSGMFGEPAWEALLALFVSDADGTALQLDSLSSLIGTPVDTCRRWLRYLAQEGLIAGDVEGDRAEPIVLTAAALMAVERWLADIRAVFEAKWGARFEERPETIS